MLEDIGSDILYFVMDCQRIQEIIPDYIRNLASEQDMQQVEAHLCMCQQCRQFLSQRVEDPAYSTREHVQAMIAQKNKLGKLDFIVIGVGLFLSLSFLIMFLKR